MKTAVVDVGGGLRGIFAAGVLDYCLEHHIDFDLCIGVSAGSANMSSYIAGQEGRNYTFFKDYSVRPEYMSRHNYIKNGSFVDMDYIYGELSGKKGENPLDYKALKKSDKELIVVATNAITGKPAYFDKSWMSQDHYDIFKASCSIPVVNQPYLIGNVPFFDGALSDPVPIEKAFEKGADKVVLLLTKPEDYIRKPYKDSAMAAFMAKYPKAAEGLRNRASKYNADVDKAREYEKEGKCLIISPESTLGVDTLSRDPAAMHRLYLMGYEAAGAIPAFLESEIVERPVSSGTAAQAEAM